MKIRCFIDANGIPWVIDERGQSNYPCDIKIDEENLFVQILGEYDGEPGEDTPRLIEDEYVLIPSLTDLALILEHDKNFYQPPDEVTIK